MPYRHEKFIVAIGIIAILSLPYLSLPAEAEAKAGDVLFAEKLAHAGFSLGSSIDKSISFAAALPLRATHAIATAIDSTTLALRSLGEAGGATLAEVSRSTYHATRHAYRQAGKQIQITNNHIQSLSLSFQRKLESSVRSFALSLRPFASHNPTPPPLSLRGGDESNKTNSPLNLSPGERGEEGQNCLGQFCQRVIPIKTRPPEQAFGRVIERIIVKEGSMQQVAGSMENNKTNPILPTTNYLLQDPRINALIANLADLTSRVDERYGVSQGGGSYSNAALFNMIAQSQRIKRLDDVTITNATIDGYATSKGVSDSLATYLPLGGGHTYGRTHRNLSYALYHP